MLRCVYLLTITILHFINFATMSINNKNSTKKKTRMTVSIEEMYQNNVRLFVQM